uniref:aldehyde oxygenase (deformylating) n=1 Tax=Ananas comosus var. bracteatus TaxID=296719 RepID=A0A6V7NGV7_ANACO|nr:unnamed protein product [Ananas comosus var. bracteatus]
MTWARGPHCTWWVRWSTISPSGRMDVVICGRGVVGDLEWEYGAYENFGEDSSVDLCISSMFGVALRCGACSGAYLITNFSEFQLATLGTFIIHESVFFLSGLPSLLFERSGLFSKYKIQKKANTPASQDKCVLRLILYHICVNLPLMIVSYPAFKFMGLKAVYHCRLGLLSYVKFFSTSSWRILYSIGGTGFCIQNGCTSIFTVFIMRSTCRYATPFGLTSEYAHPAEILFLGFATVVGPALTGPHLLTLWLWVVLRVLETVEAHSGYHFPWSPSNFLPLYGGADFHDYHHRLLYTKSGNYSSTFVYMDW